MRNAWKTNAWHQIKENIAIMLLCYLIVAVLSNIIPGLAAVILMPVLSFGLTLNYMTINRGEKATVRRLFDCFRQFEGAWVMNFMTGLFVSLWSMLFVIPGIVKAYAYRLAPYILAENPEMSGLDAITASKEMTRGHKWALFVLDLSFLGWILLSVLTFGIALIWVIPYMEATRVNAYQSIKSQYNG